MRQPTILIADDDDCLLRLLTVQCRHAGLEVRSAPDAMMALTMIHRRTPDLVLLDVTMPAGNGISVLEMLRTDSRLAGLRVVVYTGQHDDETISRCQSLGAQVVKKGPDSWRQLKPILASLITHWRREQTALAQQAE